MLRVALPINTHTEIYGIWSVVCSSQNILTSRRTGVSWKQNCRQYCRAYQISSTVDELTTSTTSVTPRCHSNNDVTVLLWRHCYAVRCRRRRRSTALEARSLQRDKRPQLGNNVSSWRLNADRDCNCGGQPIVRFDCRTWRGVIQKLQSRTFRSHVAHLTNIQYILYHSRQSLFSWVTRWEFQIFLQEESELNTS